MWQTSVEILSPFTGSQMTMELSLYATASRPPSGLHATALASLPRQQKTNQALKCRSRIMHSRTGLRASGTKIHETQSTRQQHCHMAIPAITLESTEPRSRAVPQDDRLVVRARRDAIPCNATEANHYGVGTRRKRVQRGSGDMKRPAMFHQQP